MYLIPADRMPGSTFMSAVGKRRETVKKRDHYAEVQKIRKHHPYEKWLKMREKMDEAD